MIKKVKYIADQKTLLWVETENASIQIRYSDIQPYFADAHSSSFESGRCFVSGDYLIFTFIIADGQGGAVCVWDCRQNKLVHISDGAYCVAAALDNGKLYTLHDISNFVTPYHLRVFVCPFGTMNANTEGTALYADQPIMVENYTEAVQCARLRVVNGRIEVLVGDKEILYSADENSACCMNNEFAVYYNSLEGKDSNLIIQPGMLL